MNGRSHPTPRGSGQQANGLPHFERRASKSAGGQNLCFWPFGSHLTLHLNCIQNMKLPALLALLVIGLPGLADELTPTKQPVEGWGVALNPAGDCTWKPDGGKLTMTVPGSDRPHDLSPEIGNLTAPRVVQPVKGDFIIQVRVDGSFQPGSESTQLGRTGYTGAGLVVFADEDNFVRLERATLHGQGGEPVAYTNFELRVDGQPAMFGTTGDIPTEKGKPTWLRLERKGLRLLGAMSHDGENWSAGKPKELRAEAWTRNDIVAGVAAVSTSRQPFSPTFSALSIQQAPKPGTDKVDGK